MKQSARPMVSCEPMGHALFNSIGAIFERHLTVQELAKLWGFSDDTIHRWFKDEPGVLRAKADKYNGRVRTRIEIRIPESVARRVYEKRMVKS